MDKNEEIIYRLLKEIGCEVEKIPESNKDGEKRPDFYIKLEEDNYIVELKTKGLDEEASEYRWSELEEKKIVSNVTEMERENKFSRRIRESVKQLESYEKEGFKIAWFNSVDIDAYDNKEKFRYALYGIAVLADFVKENGLARECYFFKQSDFFRHRNTLDAAFISVDDGRDIHVELFVNPLSPNYEKFKQSSIYKFFNSFGATHDPLELEKKGDIFYANEDDGESTQEVIESIKNKYDCKGLTIMPMKSITARSIVK